MSAPTIDEFLNYVIAETDSHVARLVHPDSVREILAHYTAWLQRGRGGSAPAPALPVKPTPDSAEWWRSVAQKLGVEVFDLTKQRDEARLAHECSEATLSMAVARLEGFVEGAPTQRINFLQRIDALRQLEAESAARIAQLRALRDEMQFEQSRSNLIAVSSVRKWIKRLDALITERSESR